MTNGPMAKITDSVPLAYLKIEKGSVYGSKETRFNHTSSLCCRCWLAMCSTPSFAFAVTGMAYVSSRFV